MSRMSWRAVPGPEGPALLAARGRDAALGTVVVVLTVGVFAAVVLSEVLIGVLKGVYERPRSPESLVVTTGASFPSGHAVAASATVVVTALMVGQIQRRVEGRQGAVWK